MGYSDLAPEDRNFRFGDHPSGTMHQPSQSARFTHAVASLALRSIFVITSSTVGICANTFQEWRKWSAVARPPNLSMFNNDERTQFLNGANDGNDAVASDGTCAGGGAVEFQATRHVYVHAVAVDTKGAQQRNIETLVDRKCAEGVELGWTSGSLSEQYRAYRVGMWRDDTTNPGSGYGGGFDFDRELPSGWTSFGTFAFRMRSIANAGAAPPGDPFGNSGVIADHVGLHPS